MISDALLARVACPVCLEPAGCAACGRPAQDHGACQAEYDDPSDRRFHAQPNACPTCGPRLAWTDPEGSLQRQGSDALTAAVEALSAGEVIAIKGIGGYHLAVDATDAAAVEELRRRKARDDKPFAVMVPDTETARALCVLGPESIAVLASPRRPIVLAPNASASWSWSSSPERPWRLGWREARCRSTS